MEGENKKEGQMGGEKRGCGREREVGGSDGGGGMGGGRGGVTVDSHSLLMPDQSALLTESSHFSPRTSDSSFAFFLSHSLPLSLPSSVLI